MKLEGKKIAVLLAGGFEDLEYWVTVMRLQEEGAEVVTVGPNKEEVSGKNALTAQAEATADELDAETPDGSGIPGRRARCPRPGARAEPPRPAPPGRGDRGRARRGDPRRHRHPGRLGAGQAQALRRDNPPRQARPPHGHDPTHPPP